MGITNHFQEGMTGGSFNVASEHSALVRFPKGCIPLHILGRSQHEATSEPHSGLPSHHAPGVLWEWKGGGFFPPGCKLSETARLDDLEVVVSTSMFNLSPRSSYSSSFRDMTRRSLRALPTCCKSQRFQSRPEQLPQCLCHLKVWACEAASACNTQQ